MVLQKCTALTFILAFGLKHSCRSLDFLSKILVFYCHCHSWKLTQGLLKNIWWFEAYKCWNLDMNCGHWLGILVSWNSNTLHSTSWHKNNKRLMWMLQWISVSLWFAGTLTAKIFVQMTGLRLISLVSVLQLSECIRVFNNVSRLK